MVQLDRVGYVMKPIRRQRNCLFVGAANALSNNLFVRRNWPEEQIEWRFPTSSSHARLENLKQFEQFNSILFRSNRSGGSNGQHHVNWFVINTHPNCWSSNVRVYLIDPIRIDSIAFNGLRTHVARRCCWETLKFKPGIRQLRDFCFPTPSIGCYPMGSCKSLIFKKIWVLIAETSLWRRDCDAFCSEPPGGPKAAGKHQAAIANIISLIILIVVLFINLLTRMVEGAILR